MEGETKRGEGGIGRGEEAKGGGEGWEGAFKLLESLLIPMMERTWGTSSSFMLLVLPDSKPPWERVV